MITSTAGHAPGWLESLAAWLTLRRVRVHAAILAICLWGVCAGDFFTAGPFDRAANIKFQDFLSFYISGRLLAEHRATDLYSDDVRQAEMISTVAPSDVAHDTAFPPTTHTAIQVRLPYLYAPQFALLFIPLSRLPFLDAAGIWVALNLVVYFACIAVVLKGRQGLLPHRGTVFLCAVAFPPLFHFFVRGQNSVLVLAGFTAALWAFEAQCDGFAGVALGLLIFKPQFLVAIPLVLLLARAWKPAMGIATSASAQLLLARVYFGAAVMHSYFDRLLHPSRWLFFAELSLAPIQMHSLRAFWMLLIPWPLVSFALYLVTSIAVIAITASIWRSSSPLEIRFSALTLAAVLVNPHLFVYDVLVLAPVLLLLVDWHRNETKHSSAALPLLIYLGFFLLLLGPLARWTHLQVSVLAFAALLWVLRKLASDLSTGHRLASRNSGVV